MRKLVKLGMTTIASSAALHFSLTLKARKYATGKPMTMHKVVAMIAILSVWRKVWKKVSSKASR